MGRLSKLPITVLQINAIIGLIILGILTWRIAEIIRANDLETHEIQILGAALVAGMGGVVYVVKMFAADPEGVPSGGNNECPYCNAPNGYAPKRGGVPRGGQAAHEIYAPPDDGELPSS